VSSVTGTGWPELLGECSRQMIKTAGGADGDCRRRQQIRPEVAFCVGLHASAGGRAELADIINGIPEILSSNVHTVAHSSYLHRLPSEAGAQHVAVAMRSSRREDLHVFYRRSDSSLILHALPEDAESRVMLVALAGDAAIRQATLGGRVSRVEFCNLEPGSYLVISFSLVDLDALQAEALSLYTEGKFAEALVRLEEVLETDTNDFLGWARKGYVLRRMGLADKAMDAVEEALRINPGCALAWRFKGAILRDGNKHQEGLECYLRSIELNPTDHLCWENKGNALSALGRREEARGAYAQAAKVKELHPENRY
jgi:tetratricopeptide (TPR) repeat protein